MPRAASGLYQKKTFRHGSPPPLLEHFYKEDHTQKTQKIQYIANCGAPGHHLLGKRKTNREFPENLVATTKPRQIQKISPHAHIGSWETIRKGPAQRGREPVAVNLAW